jgi:hypothetical protein
MVPVQAHNFNSMKGFHKVADPMEADDTLLDVLQPMHCSIDEVLRRHGSKQYLILVT